MDGNGTDGIHLDGWMDPLAYVQAEDAEPEGVSVCSSGYLICILRN